tara:strand:- start:1739 stop:2029 length:291 start_codon:yes stop_codon:yes gene_type:complete
MDKSSMKAQALLAQKEMDAKKPNGKDKELKDKEPKKKVGDKELKDKEPKKKVGDKEPKKNGVDMKELKNKIKEIERSQKINASHLDKISKIVNKMK